MRETNPLFTTEDRRFREQNTQHHKRPALVTIKKPLLQPSEMEDVLVRLLRKYVPPYIPSENEKYTSTRCTGVRALIFGNGSFNAPYNLTAFNIPTAVVNNTTAEGAKECRIITKARDVVFASQNIILRPNSVLESLKKNDTEQYNQLWNEKTREAENSAIEVEAHNTKSNSSYFDENKENYLRSTTNNICVANVARTDLHCSYKNILTERAQAQLNEEARARLSGHRLDIYLFWDSDKQALVDIDTYNLATDRQPFLFRSDSDLNNKYTFKHKEAPSLLPVFRPKLLGGMTNFVETEQQQQMVEIRSDVDYSSGGAYSDVNQAPTKHEIQQLLIQRVWGAESLKHRKYKALLWHFVCEINGDVTWEVQSCGKDTELSDTQSKYWNEKRTRINKILDTFTEALSELRMSGKLGKGITINEWNIALSEMQNKEYDKFIIGPTRYEGYNAFTSGLNLALIYGNKLNYIRKRISRINQANYKTEIFAICDELGSIDGSLVITTNRFTASTYKDPEQFRTVQKSCVTELKQIKKTIESDIEYSYPLSEQQNKVPMLPVKHGLDEAIKAEQEIFTYTSSNLNTRAAQTETFGSFTVKYYSVLLKKIEAKYKQYIEFFNDSSSSVKKDLLKFPYYDYYVQAQDLLRYKQKDLASPTGGDIKDNLTNGLSFARCMETLLFGPYSGFYISSFSKLENAPTAPLVNTTATILDFVSTDNSTEQNDMRKILLGIKNDDVMQININRTVVSGTPSTCNIVLKNYDNKYGFTNSNLYDYLSNVKYYSAREKQYADYSDPTAITNGMDTPDKSKNIFDPLDEVTVYLPNKDDKLKIAYTGIIQSIKATNQDGYNQIQLACTCAKRLMDLSRTNMKPSFSRDENNNKQVQAFTVPELFMNSIEYWIPSLVAQSLTYMSCQPKELTLAEYSKPLWRKVVTSIKRAATKTPTESNDTITVQSNQAATLSAKEAVKSDKNSQNDNSISGFVQSVKKASNTTNQLINANVNLDTGARLLSSGNSVNVFESSTVQATKIKTANPNTLTSKIAPSIENAPMKYNQVVFCDPLFDYLWYRTNTQLSITDRHVITNKFQELVWDYCDTYTLGTSDAPGLKLYAHGIESLSSLYAKGKRAAYIVMRQRTNPKEYQRNGNGDGYTIDFKNPINFERNMSFKLLGTTQPAFMLQPGAPEIQFSEWKTNDALIKDIANKFDFIYYTDKYGVLNLTPYNLDLSSLASNHYTLSSIPNEVIFNVHPTYLLEGSDSNYQVIKSKDTTGYTRICDETKLLNWVNITGQLQIGGSLSNMIRAVVQDPRLIAKLGIRAAKQVTILGCVQSEALTYYGLCWLDRNNKRFLASDLKGVYYSDLDINMPYYAHFDNTIYYSEALQISYTPGKDCTYTMGGVFGRKPIMRIENATKVEACLSNLRTSFINNQITPSVYAQYNAILLRVLACNKVIDKAKKCNTNKETIQNAEASINTARVVQRGNISEITSTSQKIDTVDQKVSEVRASLEGLYDLRILWVGLLDEAIAMENQEMIDICEAEIEALDQQIDQEVDIIIGLTGEKQQLTHIVEVLAESNVNCANTISKRKVEIASLTAENETLKKQIVKGAQKAGMPLMTADTPVAQLESYRNAILATIAFDGYIWDNISGLTFEEMPFYASFLMKHDLSKQWEYAIFSSETTRTSFLNAALDLSKKYKSVEEKQVVNAYSMYVTDIIALSGELLRNNIGNILHKYNYVEDLYTSPLIS